MPGRMPLPFCILHFGLTLLTKADAGQVGLRLEPIRLDELFRETVVDASILAQPARMQILLPAIAQWIVTAHQGTIEFVSEPGELTTVTVRLPRHTGCRDGKSVACSVLRVAEGNAGRRGAPTAIHNSR